MEFSDGLKARRSFRACVDTPVEDAAGWIWQWSLEVGQDGV